ncbi:MAG: ABC transporter substrate-binding protein [Candidatus Bathyarchaeia archaeon]
MNLKAVKKMITVIVVGIIIVIAATIGVYFAYFQPRGPTVSEVTILMTQPLSGANALFGESCRRGADLAVKEINMLGGVKSLGGAKLKLVVIDNRGSPDFAVTSLEEAINRYNPTAVLGSILSDIMLAVSDVTHRYDVPNLSTASAESIYTRGYDNLFCFWPTTTQQIQSWPNLLKEISDKYGAIQKVAVIYLANAYGRALGGGIKDKLRSLGFEIVYASEYDPKIADASPIITQVKNSNAEALISVSYLSDGILIYRTMTTLGCYIAFISGMPTYQIDWNNTLGLSGSCAFTFGTPYCWDIQHPSNIEFVKKFKESYGMIPDAFGGVYYCMTWLLYEAIEYAGSIDPMAIKQAIREMGDKGLYYGPSTILVKKPKFTPEGYIANYSTIACQWINGLMVTVAPSDVASAKPIWPVNATVFGKYIPNWPLPKVP